MPSPTGESRVRIRLPPAGSQAYLAQNNCRSLTFHSTSPPKRALLSVSTASSLVAAPPGPSAGLVVVQASRQPRCGFGERGDGDQADEQASKDQGRSKGWY